MESWEYWSAIFCAVAVGVFWVHWSRRSTARSWLLLGIAVATALFTSLLVVSIARLPGPTHELPDEYRFGLELAAGPDALFFEDGGAIVRVSLPEMQVQRSQVAKPGGVSVFRSLAWDGEILGFTNQETFGLLGPNGWILEPRSIATHLVEMRSPPDANTHADIDYVHARGKFALITHSVQRGDVRVDWIDPGGNFAGSETFHIDPWTPVTSFCFADDQLHAVLMRGGVCRASVRAAAAEASACEMVHGANVRCPGESTSFSNATAYLADGVVTGLTPIPVDAPARTTGTRFHLPPGGGVRRVRALDGGEGAGLYELSDGWLYVEEIKHREAAKLGLLAESHTGLTKVGQDGSRREAFLLGSPIGSVYEHEGELLILFGGANVLARFDSATLARRDPPSSYRQLDRSLRLTSYRGRQAGLAITLAGAPFILAAAVMAWLRHRRSGFHPSDRFARVLALYCLAALPTVVTLALLRLGAV